MINLDFIITNIFKILLIVMPLIGVVAFLTYFERKIIAAMQLRRGPNVVGPFGLFQPIADGMKLLFKEPIIPYGANKILFLLAPVVTYSLALMGWAVIPFSESFVIADINVGILYILAISSLGVYGVIMAGWASNSKYALLGAVRSSAQMISYEVSIGIIIANVILMSGSFNLSEIVLAQQDMWYVVPLFPMFILFFISTLAETNRHPFDLPEAEAELVAGYNVEYSSMPFALFFLGEYANMILMCSLTAILFLGGWLPPMDIPIFNSLPGQFWLFLKVSILIFVFVWVRATIPRYRYDQLMRLGWKVFLPLSLFWLFLTATYLVIFDKLAY
ncbi:MAG: NADH-quinone oxidoreductase subunit NuoH [Rickettsiales bacterium]|jgi:NADH-quinone oxidoreductase subunit H|nr:NADH-quinone oxidoreductase subunit NuoH [Rickettsiales bacterium]